MTAALNKALGTLIIGILFFIPILWTDKINFFHSTPKFFLMYVAAGLIIVLNCKAFRWPRIDLYFWIGLLTILFFQICYPLLLGRYYDYFDLFKFLILLVLAYFFYSLEFDLKSLIEKKTWAIFTFFLIIAILNVVDIYYNRVVIGNANNGAVFGTLGNINTIADFFVLSFPLLVYWKSVDEKVHRIFKWLLLSGWFLVLIYCQSRSAWLGLFGVSVFFLLKRKLDWIDVSAFFFALLLYYLLQQAPVSQVIDTSVKARSSNIRLSLIKSTLQLILDHPWGIGHSRFLSEIVPYLIPFKILRENIFYDQPHIEFLKWGVQFGWLGFLSAVSFTFYWFYLIYRKSNWLLTAAVIVILPQLVFFFPFENSASILVLAFYFGLYFKTLGTLKVFYFNFRQSLWAVILALVFFVFSGVFVSSVYYQSAHRNDESLIQYSCSVNSADLIGCYNRLRFFVQSRNHVAVIESFKQDRELLFLHAGHLRMLGIYLGELGRESQACEAVNLYAFLYKDHMYASIYKDHIYFKDSTLELCRTKGLPFQYVNPVQFRSDYLKWYDQVLNSVSE